MPSVNRRFTDWVDVFEDSAAPYLVLDRNLCISAVNEAYREATLQVPDALLGHGMFEAFPDNPETPEARSVANLTRSLEAVLRFGQRDRMPIQRYDVPARDNEGTFVRKFWRPINSPLRDRSTGAVVGVLHHVEDVTAAVDRATRGTRPTTADDCPVDDVAVALAHEQQVTAVLRDRGDHLETALQTNREIGAAIGIVMSAYKVTYSAAFDMIRTVSTQTNRKLRDIAHDIVEQGTLDV
ncbi:hypothetical protein DQ239_16975 [Blastococcus sp. TF02-09]|uniref:ANTAR domain-containing protein n=1 Tax=Blastococcus sp. TF02-09 TaxID=2250576 RepID=UPI000DE8588E|nr:ANTAR domain-containing protein [Blastococcus sp. TF02-9]RBY75367.1 hypothetical protein DQ239_16975 [Blastococcus sp. TF02-9]